MRHSTSNKVSWSTVLSVVDSLAPRRLWLGGACVASLTVLMGMALLGLSGWFITATALAGLVPATALMFDVFMPSAGIRLLAIGRTGTRYAERLLTHDATLAALASLRVKLFVHWARPQAARQLLLRPARLLQRLTADVDALDSLYLRLLVPTIAALGAALLLGLALGLMRWWLGLAGGLWLLLAGWGIALWHARCTVRQAARRALAVENLRAQTIDLVAGQTELLMAGRLPAHIEKVLASDARAARADEALYRIEARATMAYGVASAITLTGVLLAVGWLVQEQAIGVAVAVLGILLALSAMEPFAALRRGATEAGRTWLALRRLGPALMAVEVTEKCLPLPETGYAVQLSNVSVLPGGAVAEGGKTARLLGPIDLSVRSGERIALMGTSGAGKTTLLQLIAGELSACQGEVAAVRCSWMTQRTELFADSVRGNLQLASRELLSDEALWTSLQAAGLAADIRALPLQLDTLLGEGGQGLSGGQARRLALARLLLSDAPCWLLDEPTEGLDDITASDVLARLAKASQGRTVIVATHMQREAQLAQRLLRIEGAVVVDESAHGSQAFVQLLGQLKVSALQGIKGKTTAEHDWQVQAAIDFEVNQGERN